MLSYAIGRCGAELEVMPDEPSNSVTATVCIQTNSWRLKRRSTGSLSGVAKLG
jgi:hypothetical protein